MRSPNGLFAVLSALLGFSCLATSGTASAGEKELEPAVTPKDALIRGYTALADGDEAKALQIIQTTNDGQRELLRALIASNRASLRFRAAFIKAYGAPAWKKFQDPKQGPKGTDAVLNVIVKDEILELLKKSKIKEERSEARAHHPKRPRPTLLKKVAKGWVMPFEGNFVPVGDLSGESLPQASKSLRAATAEIERYQKAIGHPGISAEDIDVELGRALLKLRTGAVGKGPHRFDIDKLK